MFAVSKPPERIARFVGYPVFLAGSIEMGAAENWQEHVTDLLERAGDYHVLNPRREDWDSSWEQSIENKQFREQVEWELDYQSAARAVLMNFCAETKSPITLLELGLLAGAPTSLYVCCPSGFWRRGNVEVVCARHAIPIFDQLDQMVEVFIYQTANGLALD